MKKITNWPDHLHARLKAAAKLDGKRMDQIIKDGAEREIQRIMAAHEDGTNK